MRRMYSHASSSKPPGQVFHVVGAAQRVHHVGDARLVGQNLLGAKGYLYRLLGGQRKGFVPRVHV